MKHEHRTNWGRHHGGRPPPPAPHPPSRNGAGTGLMPSALRLPEDVDLTPRGATEEVGLTLTPPPRYRSLLVPLDGSPFGEHALPLALGIARRSGADVRLVHAHSPLES